MELRGSQCELRGTEMELDDGTNISAEKKGPTRPDPVVTVLSSFVWKVVFYVNLIFYIFRVNKSGDFKSK